MKLLECPDERFGDYEAMFLDLRLCCLIFKLYGKFLLKFNKRKSILEVKLMKLKEKFQILRFCYQIEVKLQNVEVMFLNFTIWSQISLNHALIYCLPIFYNSHPMPAAQTTPKKDLKSKNRSKFIDKLLKKIRSFITFLIFISTSKAFKTNFYLCKFHLVISFLAFRKKM